MEHYDGPAFFRRKREKKQDLPKKQLNRQPSVHQSKSKPEHATKHRPTPVSRPKQKALDSARSFYDLPRFNSARKQEVETNSFLTQKRRRQGIYELFKQELALTTDKLILMDTTASDYDFDLDKRNGNFTPEQKSASEPVESSEIRVDDQELQTDNSKPVEHFTETDSSNLESAEKPVSPKHVKVRRGLGKSFRSMVHREREKASRLNVFNDQKKTELDNQSSNIEKSTGSVEANSATPSADSKPESVGLHSSESQSYSSETSSDKLDITADNWVPSINLLDHEQTNDAKLNDSFVTDQITKLNKTLSAFKVHAEVVNYTVGPTITQFEVKLALGVKVSRITNLADDIKLALAAKDVRIEAPIPGRSTVGIEVPNPQSRPVNLAEIIDSPEFVNNDATLLAAVGEDISGKPVVGDISKMPHALIAGATGSGKSVFINGLLTSLLYKASPADLKLLLIDPKAVELSMYSGIPHLLAPVISDPQTATQALKWVTKEMDERYEKLAAASVQNIKQYNDRAEQAGEYGLKMPYILIVIDELADLMMVSSQDTETYIARITQKARAAGIHLIVATQRPSVDVVTGTIKNNIPTRIAFAVSSQIDSRTILDSSGAEKLLGRGDMLYLRSGASKPVRLQGAFVKNDEIHRVINFVRSTGSPHYQFSPEQLKKSYEEAEQNDPIMGDVLEYIAGEDSISTSKLQRVFSIGYNRAATIIDDLEDQHYISEQHGSKPREVYYRKNSDQE